ncbi:hypothetical protein ACFLRX_03705 [Acidobacteriota bacterium]
MKKLFKILVGGILGIALVVNIFVFLTTSVPSLDAEWVYIKAGEFCMDPEDPCYCPSAEEFCYCRVWVPDPLNGLSNY